MCIYFIDVRETVQVLYYLVRNPRSDLTFRKFREEGGGTIGGGLRIMRMKTKEVR